MLYRANRIFQLRKHKYITTSQAALHVLKIKFSQNMAANKEGYEQENVIKNLQDNIQLVTKQIKDEESKCVEHAEFDKEIYWNKVAVILKVLSAETTKISLAFSKKPFPSSKNTEAMVNELEKSMLALVSVYYALPLSQGVTLHSCLQQTVLQVLANLHGFTSSLSACVVSESHSSRLQWTGGIWEAVDFTLLKDNKDCTLKRLKETADLVQDALGEMEEAMESEGQVDEFLLDSEKSNADVWSEQDKLVVASCKGLVKTMKSVMKKCQDCVHKHGETDTREGIAGLDELVDLTSTVSKTVDDFVCGIYAPVNYTALVQNGTALTELTKQILKFLRDSRLTHDDDAKWLNFLSHASTHNMDKLKCSVLPSPDTS